MTTSLIRRCRPGDWSDVRHLHVQLALGLPLAVDVDLNEVLTTPATYWQDFVDACSEGSEQALFVAPGNKGLLGMGHVGREDDQARLDMLYVEGAVRRRGLGRAIVDAQVRWALSMELTDFVCHIPEKSAARFVAESLGWKLTEEVFHTARGFKEHKWITTIEQPSLNVRQQAH